MQWTGNVISGAWISERLNGWGQVGGVVPRGFEAYARVFHPVETRRLIAGFDPMEVETRTVTWADVAAAKGTTWHPEAQWGALSTSQYDEVELGDGWMVSPPDQGRLALDQLATLCGLLAENTETPSDAVVGVWSGWGEIHPGSGTSYVTFTKVDDEPDPGSQRNFDEAVRNSVSDDVARAASIGPTLELPGRGYVLLTADVREFTDSAWVETSGLGWFFGHGPTPNILWPADRAWFLGSEIDFDSTLVGGSRGLVDAMLAHPKLEVAEVTENTDLTINADSINPPADG